MISKERQARAFSAWIVICAKHEAVFTPPVWLDKVHVETGGRGQNVWLDKVHVETGGRGQK